MTIPEKNKILLGNSWIEYYILRSEKRKTIAVSISLDNQIKIYAPKKVSFEEIEKFLCSKENWILLKLDKIKRIQKNLKKHFYKNGEIFSLFGKDIQLYVKEHSNMNKRIYFKKKDSLLEITIPKKSINKIEQIKSGITEFYKSQAINYVSERAKWYSWNYGIRIGNVMLSNAKKIWGSCDSYGNLRFNWRIIMADKIIIDYVIAHEISHIRHPNHSKEFWEFVESIYPDYKLCRKKLKEMGVYYDL